MAESCTIAFGRYLRTLRERRGFSLDNVTSLSQTFPEQIHKGYLSRCENGRQKLAFVKAVPLSRIYDVPADVLVERMELDMELDRVGSPPTEGLAFEELVSSGRAALESGYRLNAYAFLRDAVQITGAADSEPDHSPERTANAYRNVASAARALGRNRFALHELLFVENCSGVGPVFKARTLERIASCYRSLRDLRLAARYADRAIEEALDCGDADGLGYDYAARAHVAFDQADVSFALSLYHKSYKHHQMAGHDTACSLILSNLSQCYFTLERFGSARRSCLAALKLAQANGQHRVHAMGLLMLGKLEDRDGRIEKAVVYWKNAARLGKQLNDRAVRFKADYLLYQNARRQDDQPVVRAIERRLRKLAPSVPRDTVELSEFQAIS